MEESEITEEKQNDKPYLFKKGQSGNPAGRPKGSLSITTAIRRFLEDNPDKFEELMQDYLEDKKHRELLWKMIDGMPKQQVDTEVSGNITIAISEDIAKKYDIEPNN